LVPDTDVRARRLFCIPGQKIPMSDAVDLGLVKRPAKKAAKRGPNYYVALDSLRSILEHLRGE